MNTKLLMTISSLVMGITGIVLSFLPREIMTYMGVISDLPIVPLFVQVMGALYFGFGMTNWTARANLIGGIYGRPIAIGNVAHFVAGSFALLKGYIAYHDVVLLVATIVYFVFAILFSVVFFRHPLGNKSNSDSTLSH